MPARPNSPPVHLNSLSRSANKGTRPNRLLPHHTHIHTCIHTHPCCLYRRTQCSDAVGCCLVLKTGMLCTRQGACLAGMYRSGADACILQPCGRNHKHMMRLPAELCNQVCNGKCCFRPVTAIGYSPWQVCAVQASPSTAGDTHRHAGALHNLVCCSSSSSIQGQAMWVPQVA